MTRSRSVKPVRPPRGERATAPRLVRISDLARLSGVPTPTIKHYVREGLLPGPDQRTSRNMAYYDPRLADRVKVIKDLQQERFLPLKLISDLLEPPPSSRIRSDLDTAQRQQLGELAPAIAAGSDDARVRRAGATTRARTRREVLAHLRIEPDDLEILTRLGLLSSAGRVDGDPVYSGADLELMEVIDEVRRKGLGDLFPMPILEPYAAAIRTLVRVELELFRRQVLSGARLPAMSLDAIARDATALGERLVVAMRSKLVIPELEALAHPPPAPVEAPVATAPAATAPTPPARPAPARPPKKRRR